MIVTNFLEKLEFILDKNILEQNCLIIDISYFGNCIFSIITGKAVIILQSY